MLKRRIRRAAQAAVFFALLLACVALASHVLEHKESRERIGPFLENADKVDVLITGTSHAINAVYPLELWRDYGIASYNIAGLGNTMAVTYWTAMMALEYAQPKLIVIDVDDIGRGNRASGSSGELHIALDAWPLTRTKLQAIEDLTDGSDELTSEGERYADIGWEYVFKLGKYHTRWSEMGAGDFTPPANRLRGARMEINVAEPRDYNVIDERQTWDQGGWGYEYLRRLIEACQARGIDVLLTQVPFPASQEEQEKANAARYIAEEYGVELLDFVNMDSVVDYETDCFGAASHLNPSGGRKVTDFLGRYIRQHFDIPNRCGDADYASWDDDLHACEDDNAARISETEKIESVLMLLHDAQLSAVVAIPRASAAYEDEKVLRLLQNIAREHVYEENAYSLWSSGLKPLGQLELAAAHGTPYLAAIDRSGDGEAYAAPGVTELLGTGEDVIETGFGELGCRSGEDGHELTINGEPLFENLKGSLSDLCIAVIDNRTGGVITVRRFDVE